MQQADTLGDRLRNVRKRRGLSQRELADLSGVSVSLIRKLEQGEREDTRLETVRKLAVALRAPTSALVVRPDAEDADSETAADWEPVRRALAGVVAQPEEPPTAEGVAAVLADTRPALAVNQYSGVRAVLPGLLRDADGLNGQGRKVRSRVLNMTGWLLVQTRQWDAADTALHLAVDGAADRLEAGAAVNTMCWSLLRQGKLAKARDLASGWADDIEPRFSRATVRELAIWGRLLLGVANAAIRDARPGEAEDAVQLARAAADRIGREITSDASTTRTFGPATVTMIEAENAAITERPGRVLALAHRVPVDVLHPWSASRCRHRLDVANAHVQLRQHAEAVTILRELKRNAPEWLVQQRYARDVVGRMIQRRRTLTPEMRDLADFVRLPL